jgi:hypothetical protein
VQFDDLWSSTSKSSSDPEAPKASTSKGCERCYNVDLKTLCDQGQSPKVQKVLVEPCDEAIGKENDHLKIEVKRLELEVNKLKKQAKVQPSKDNHRNMVEKLEKGKPYLRLPLNIKASQFVTRRKRRTLWMKRLNVQGVPT